MVNSNLNQRQKLLPSEKAFAYKLQMDSINNQGKRTDLEKDNFTTNGREVENQQESKRNIQRYIRLTELIKPLLDMVDKKTLALRVGVNLSYLPDIEQETVYKYIVDNKIKLSLEKSEEIKKIAEENNINLYHLEFIFKKSKKEKEPTYVKLPYSKLEKIMDISLPIDYQEEYILKAIKYYRDKQEDLL